jgi:hypothetical protein
LPATISHVDGALLFLPSSSASMIKMSGSPMEPHVLRGVRMDEHVAALGVQVAVGFDGDALEVARATLQLRRELLDLDVDAVDAPGAGEPPPGARGMDVAAVGALVVNFADSQVLAAVVTAIRSWLAGSPRRSIKLELGGDVLELTGVSSAEQRRLTDEWLARHIPVTGSGRDSQRADRRQR